MKRLHFVAIIILALGLSSCNWSAKDSRNLVAALNEATDKATDNLKKQDAQSRYRSQKTKRLPKHKGDALPPSGVTRPVEYGVAFTRGKDGVIRLGHEAPNDPFLRCNIRDFPLRVYSDHRQSGGKKAFDKIVEKSISTLNEAAQRIGIRQGFFVLTNDASRADLKVDWTGRFHPALISKEAAGIAVVGGNFQKIQIKGVGMLSPSYYLTSRKYRTGTLNIFKKGSVLEILLQEMAHILGSGHSGGESDTARADSIYKNDVLFPRGHGHKLGGHRFLFSVKFSDRDVQMLHWLYSQKDYFPISIRR